MKKSRLLSVLGIAMLGVLVIQSRSDAAIVQTSSLWKKRVLRVCFAETRADIKNAPVDLRLDSRGETEVLSKLKIVPLNAELKRMIEAAVTASFTPEKTAVSFAGFKLCREDPGAEVTVFYVQDETDPELITERFLGAGEIGKPTNVSKNSVRINDSKLRGYLNETVSLTMMDLIRWKYGKQDSFEKNWENFGRYELVKDIVHEFGHVAGLVHEHERFRDRDLKHWDISDSADGLIKDNANLKIVQTILPPVKIKNYGKLNPVSTMNYLRTDYDERAENTKLTCDLLESLGSDEPQTFADIYFRRLYRVLISEPTSEFSRAKLKEYLCSDQRYLALTPKVQYEQENLLDHQDQSALKNAYTGAPFEDLDVQELSLMEYIQSRWLPNKPTLRAP